jgi:hypothetical protein
MKWITRKHTKSTDNKTEHFVCEGIVNFPTSTWNQNEETPVIEIRYNDRKYEYGYWLDKEETKWYVMKPSKSCLIKFHYLQRHPEVNIYSGVGDIVSYEEFTLDYCKNYAENIFKERLNEVIKQLK